MTRHCPTTWILIGAICGGVAPGVLASGLSSPQPTSDPSLELPEPTGRFPVGTVVHLWEDGSRVEVAANPPAPPRTLVVQLWYPAESGSGSPETSAYLDELVEAVAREMLGADLGPLRTHAREGADVAGEEESYPVVLFSPGFGISRSLYTILYEELASHGYIVAAIDHPYMNLVVLPGQGLVDPAGGHWNTFPVAGPAASVEEARRKLDDAHDHFAADQLFVLEKLAELNRSGPPGPLSGRLDLGRVGSLGHSAGALAPHGLMLRETAVDAVVLYDVEVDRLRAGPDIVVPVSGTVRVPTLAFRLEYAPPPETSFESQLRQPLFDVLVDGATHLGVTDVPVLKAVLLGDATRKAVAVARLRDVVECTRSFLDTHVKDAGSHPGSWEYRPRPGVSVRRLRPSWGNDSVSLP